MHTPVLQKKVLDYLDPKPNENFIDCTIGGGGHTLAIMEKTGPEGKVLGVELDPELYEKIKEKSLTWGIKQRLVLVNDSFANLKEIVEKEKFGSVDGILIDLGLSSWHLERSGRGFSFLKNEPLDMRYSSQTRAQNNFVFDQVQKICVLNPLTAEKIVNYWSGLEIEKILTEYGEEKFANRITKKVIEERKIKPIKTTFQLVEIIKKVTPEWYQKRKIHPATKTFQALRIAVNDELENLKKALPQTLKTLVFGGRLVIISFHSLEDRIVKNFLKQSIKFRSKKFSCSEAKEGLQILTKKPIKPSLEEIKNNYRSRSARLRAAKKYDPSLTTPESSRFF